MNSTARFLFGFVIALTLPVSVVTAGGHRAGGSFSRPSGAARPAAQARPTFRGSGATFQRPNYNWAANNRISNASRLNRGGLNANRAFINRNTRSWNRFNGAGTNRFSSNNFNAGNRFSSNRFNHSANWWRRHHHDCDSFIFFGGFGFPFFTAWDYGFFPTAYYPYYPYTPYSYDPYGYSYSGYGYPAYSDGGYSNESGYEADPGYNSKGGYDGAERSERGGNQSHSVVAQVQERLARAGYYKGAVDGVQGSRTYYAIRSYQRDHNLPVSGRINNELLDELGIQ